MEEYFDIASKLIVKINAINDSGLTPKFIYLGKNEFCSLVSGSLCKKPVSNGRDFEFNGLVIKSVSDESHVSVGI